MSKKPVMIDGKPVAPVVAEDFKRLAAAFKKATGQTLHVRSGVRDSREQEKIFLARFKPQKTGTGKYGDVKVWNGVRYVRISPAGTVAVPGTSGHETGRDIDIHDSGKDYGVTRAGTKRSNWIKSNARKYGFNPRGFTFGEPWHIESTRGNYWSVSPAVGLLRVGSRGTAVRNAQRDLARHGFLKTNQVDGIFGKITDAAVRTFQRARGLAVDGIIGKQTLKALAADNPERARIRIGSLNIPLDPAKLPDGKKRAKVAAAQINRSDLGVVVFQELDRGEDAKSHEWAEMMLAALGDGWKLVKPTTNYNENYLAYRPAVTDLAKSLPDLILKSDAGGRHSTRAVFKVGDGDVEIHSTHLVSGSGNDAARKTQGDQLAKSAAKVSIVAGDLNQKTLPGGLAKSHKTARTAAKATTNAEWGTYATYGSKTAGKGVRAFLDHIAPPHDANVRGYTVVGLSANGVLDQPRASDHLLIIASIEI